MGDNIIMQLQDKIKALNQTIEQLRTQQSIEVNEMNELNNKYQSIKMQYDAKKMELANDARKIKEKSDILREAKLAYDKILSNTQKLVMALDNTISKN